MPGPFPARCNVRGFALKFCTEEGNWYMVGNNTPVFSVRDPLKFPDFIHTQKRHPESTLRGNTAAWNFWSLLPESLHQVTLLMSDRGLPRSLRDVNGYGGPTYSSTTRMLLKPGADAYRRNHRGQTPLGGAAFKGHEEIVARLLEHGADIDA